MHLKSLCGCERDFVFAAMLCDVSALTMMLSDILHASNITNQLFLFSCSLCFSRFHLLFLQLLFDCVICLCITLEQKPKVSIFFFSFLICAFPLQFMEPL